MSYTDPSGGGGGAIYKDGNPVSVQLANGESTTVPTGETWVVTLSQGAKNGWCYTEINGERISGFDDNNNTVASTADVVLKAGDTVTVTSASSDTACNISGWVV